MVSIKSALFDMMSFNLLQTLCMADIMNCMIHGMDYLPFAKNRFALKYPCPDPKPDWTRVENLKYLIFSLYFHTFFKLYNHLFYIHQFQISFLKKETNYSENNKDWRGRVFKILAQTFSMNQSWERKKERKNERKEKERNKEINTNQR